MSPPRESLAEVLPPRPAPAIASQSSHAKGHEPRPTRGTSALWLGLFGLTLFLVRLSAPPDFAGNEWRVAAYALDVVENGRWWSQTDTLGEVAGKPPLLTWLVALTMLPTGRISQAALYWPSACATVGTAWVLLSVGWSHFGWRAGLFAGVSYLASYVAFDQMRMARYDGLLALPVTLGAAAAWHAWQSGRGWTWFWTVAALGTLVKGPLAVALSAAGLLASRWKEPFGTSLRLRGTHWAGLAIYLAVVGGWLVAAYLQAGPRLIEKMLQREMVAHAVGAGANRWLDLARAYEPPWFLLVGFAPWSALTVASACRAVARPAADLTERRFERYLLVALAAGLLMFSLAAHHRARLIYPVVPVAALLAGRELGRWTARLEARTVLGVSAAVGIAVLALSIHATLPGPGGRAEAETRAARDLALALHRLGPGEFPLTYLDGWLPLQVWRNTRRVVVPVEQAAQFLRGDAAAFVLVGDLSPALAQALGGHPVAELFRWPSTGTPRARIVSNRPRLEWPASTAMALDGLHVQMEAARLLRTAGPELAFLGDPAGAAVAVTNRSPTARQVRLRLTRPGAIDLVAEQRLAAGTTWREAWARAAPQ